MTLTPQTFGGGSLLAGAALLLPATAPGAGPFAFALLVPAVLLFAVGVILVSTTGIV